MKNTSLLLIVTTLSLAGASAFGGTLTFNGNTTGLSPFNRPTEPGDALSDIGTAVPYFAQQFTVGLSGNYNLVLQAANPGAYDSFLHLYAGSFNAAAPLNNFLAANDDAPGGSAFGSALTGVSLMAGGTYVFVTDGFANSDFGAFTASITGPGTVSVVPEPSAIVLAGLGLASLCAARRRNNSQTR